MAQSGERRSDFEQQVSETRSQLDHAGSTAVSTAEQTDAVTFDVETKTHSATLEALRACLESFQVDAVSMSPRLASYC